MSLSELCLPFVRALAFASRTTSALNARRESAEATLLFDAAEHTPSKLIEQLQSRIGGLTEQEVREQRAVHGRNAVAHERSTPWPMLLFNNLRNPFIAVLALLGVVSYATDDVKGTVVVSVMVVVSVVMRFIQEYRSSNAADALRSMVLTTATVSRDGQRCEVPFEELVPGDIVHLSAGDMVPADVRLLSAKDVFVNQAALALERALLAEEAEKSQVSAETERLRSALLSSVSHDFRTPLAAVTGAATSLLQEGDKLGSEARTELLQTIREESERLGRIVTDLLEITRIESGAVQVKKEWCPLEEVIGSALARLEGKLVGRDVKVDLSGPMLQAPLDAVLAEQLFFNLIENAVKYTPAGSPIEVHAHEEGQQVVVEIRDRGPGIAPGDEQRIFERFYRSPDGGRVGGAGLGLAVCQAVVGAHGGEITARSRDGGGTLFRFTLPVEGTPPVIDDGPLMPARK